MTKVDDLVSQFVENGWVYETKHCKLEEEMFVRMELFILGALKVLASHAPSYSEDQYRNQLQRASEVLPSLHSEDVQHPGQFYPVSSDNG